MSKTSSKILSAIQWITTSILAYGVYGLVIQEYELGNICPKIFDIPACYIIAGGLLCIFISLLWRKLYFPFLLGAGIGWSIAAMGSYYQWKGIAECPKMADGTPICYIALALFTLLFILDFFKK